MSRIARVVVPGLPYHVTHRGNLRSAVFFTQQDREIYLGLLEQHANKEGLAVWAYCLMTNHVHLIAVPEREDSMAEALGRAHMQYSRRVNRDHGWSGHLWANRYHSTPMDGEHLWEAIRYVELNPVRARMVVRAEEYLWSSCRLHSGLEKNYGVLAEARPFPGTVGTADWARWINAGVGEEAAERIRTNTLSGRPCGAGDFVRDLEQRLGRLLAQPHMGRPRHRDTGEELTPDLFG